MKKDPLYIGIARALEQQISREVLKAGDKLPSIRTVQREYGVSMNTAVQAFFVLERKALVESRPQSGYYVSNSFKRRLAVPSTSKPAAPRQQEQAEALIDAFFRNMNQPGLTRFSLGVPDDALLPIAKLNKGLVQAMRTLPGSGTGYEDLQGNLRLRRQIARWSFTWGSTLTEDDLVTTAGAINALSYSLMALTKPGDTLAVESPVYFGILQLARSLGLKVLELPTHPVTGLELSALKKMLSRINVCLLIPNFNNPLGSCMPEDHKKELVAMLAGNGIPLIEDDMYGDVYFGDSRPRPCKAFDETGSVLWCGSVSKTLAPGYRVGWVAPGRYRDQILRLKQLHAISTTTLTQEVIAGFLENGRYEHHLRNMRRILHTNSLHFSRAIADHFPEGTRVSRPQGGFVLWTELPAAIDTAALYQQALLQKISIAPGRMFTLQDQFNHCMRLSYGQQWSTDIDNKLKVLGKIAKGLLR
ncbi:MAG: PLP-dependent aminotransferase family protein [Candidatus Pseudobacter hemicellulosilyticus]|uniref:PLP-dependent aminotransferase family protein n=1 Tax=Candidatus Pseudobacter hemicellulosilyticus TaxID=3121375 RepID=A0AAJ5WPR5_9BACT|nr:MAG: PLP-dependent aminotransferase family protein [Pseudobacter sp.]